MQELRIPQGRTSVKILRFETIAAPHAISTRIGGLSKAALADANIADNVGDSRATVTANRKIVCASANLDGRRFACMEQMHSDAIAIVSPTVHDIDHAIPVGGIDALICNEPDITLMAQSADCPMVLLHDPTACALAVIHSGWRSTLANITAKTVTRMMSEFGCSPGNIQAGISPCICQKHYEVGSDVSSKFQAAFSALPCSDYLLDAHSGKSYLDLAAIIAWQLKVAGVSHVEVADLCTYEREDLLYSHRRDKGKTGRFGLFAQL